jgi:hypothetical protein
MIEIYLNLKNYFIKEEKYESSYNTGERVN